MPDNMPWMCFSNEPPHYGARRLAPGWLLSLISVLCQTEMKLDNNFKPLAMAGAHMDDRKGCRVLLSAQLSTRESPVV